MESNYREKDFEHYVKQNADQHRMFPSDKVWKSINNTLHTRRKWYGFWLGSLLLLTGAAVTWVMTTQPGTNEKAAVLENIYTVRPAEENISQEAPSELINDLNPFTDQKKSSLKTFIPGPVTIDAPGTAENLPAEAMVSPFDIFEPAYTEAEKKMSKDVTRIDAKTNTDFSKIPQPLVSADVRTIAYNPGENPAPYTIESVTNSYEFKRPAKKISWQLFVTPTVSYRKLSVNKSTDNPSAYNYPFASLSDINNAVTHKPDMGLQIGVSGRYPITKNLKLLGGLQFNINRYDIKAYAFNGEVATIDLNGGTGGNSSISTWTNYRNYAGYKSDWLKNYYFSVSAPFGAEVKLFGNKKTSFGVAGTLQPTYIIKDRAYLISTDYKNYAEVPRLIRHVNLNTSFETFVNYTNRKTKWQVGPQVRYQVLSSFHNTYPVKENLFDFGVKIGVTLNE